MLVASGFCVGRANFVAQASNTLAVGILGLEVAKFGFVTHFDVPFAEGQADFCLIERLYTQPLADAAFAQDTSFFPGALEGVLQQGIFVDHNHSVTHFGGQEFANYSSLVSKPFHQDVKQADLRQERRYVVADDGDEREESNAAVIGSSAYGGSCLEINKIIKAVQADGYQVTQQGNEELLPANSCMTNVTKSRAKAGSKG